MPAAQVEKTISKRSIHAGTLQKVFLVRVQWLQRPWKEESTAAWLPNCHCTQQAVTHTSLNSRKFRCVTYRLIDLHQRPTVAKSVILIFLLQE